MSHFCVFFWRLNIRAFGIITTSSKRKIIIETMASRERRVSEIQQIFKRNI